MTTLTVTITPTDPPIVTLWHVLTRHNAGVARARAELRLARIIGHHPTEDDMVADHTLPADYCASCDTFGDLFGCQPIVDEDQAIADLRAHVDAQVAANQPLADLMARPHRITT